MSMSMEGWETVGTNLFLYPVGCQRFVTHSEYLNTTYLQQGSLHIRICKTLYVYFLFIRKRGKLGFKLQNPPLDQDFEWLAAIWPLRPDWAVHPYHNPEDEMWMITNFEFEVRSLNFAKNIESENVVVVVQTGRPIGIEVPKCCFARSSSASRLTITMLQMYSD